MSENPEEDSQRSGILNIVIKLGSVATAITAIVSLVVLVLQLVEPDSPSSKPNPSSSKQAQVTPSEPESDETSPKLTTKPSESQSKEPRSPEPTPEPTSSPQSTPESSPSPDPTPKSSALPAGTSIDLWGRPQIGDFRLVGGIKSKDASSLGATDYRVATYQAVDGQQVQSSLVEFSSTSGASQLMQQLVDQYVSGQGYQKISEGRTDTYQGQSLDTWVWLMGNSEMVLWTEGNYLLISEGPYPHAKDFFDAIS